MVVALQRLDQQVVRTVFRKFGEHVEISPAVEQPRVQHLELRLVAPAPPVLRPQPLVGKLRLRVFVECAHPRVRRCRVEAGVALLHVLAVVFPRAPSARTIVPSGSGSRRGMGSSNAVSPSAPRRNPSSRFCPAPPRVCRRPPHGSTVVCARRNAPSSRRSREDAPTMMRKSPASATHPDRAGSK